MKKTSSAGLAVLMVLVVALSAPWSAWAQESTVDGSFTANGEAIELPYVYVYAKEEGFYDESDPAWEIIFASQEIEESEVDEFFHDFPYVKISITLTDEFGEGERLEVYSQNIKLSADGGNLSGGTYPEMEWESSGPELFAGRIYHSETQEFFDDTYHYDFTFSAGLSDANAASAPVGDPLPEGGGEPGQAYLAWNEAIRAMDVERLKTLVPPEMAEMLAAPEAKEDLEFMREMAPETLTITGGSSDGTTAILQVIGVFGGEPAEGEIELLKQDGFWMPVRESW